MWYRSAWERVPFSKRLEKQILSICLENASLMAINSIGYRNKYIKF